MASSSFQLVVRNGPNPGKVYELNKPEMVIGRETGNDIVISDIEVSRRHARLLAQSGSYLLEDNGSTNGTFIEGKRLLGPHLLRPGEIIRLGENVMLAFEAVGTDAGVTFVGGPAFPATPPPTEPAPPPVYPPVNAAPQPLPPMQRTEPQPLPPPYTPPAYIPPSQPPSYPPQQPAYNPPASYPPDPYAGAGYANQVPIGPPPDMAPPAPEKKKINPLWIVGGCGCLVIIICLVLVAFMYWVDLDPTGARWCQFFGAILNVWDPAACPMP